jgi:hypothetical protein
VLKAITQLTLFRSSQKLTIYQIKSPHHEEMITNEFALYKFFLIRVTIPKADNYIFFLSKVGK